MKLSTNFVVLSLALIANSAPIDNNKHQLDGPSTTLKKRQSLEGLGGLSTGLPSSGSSTGTGSLGSGSTGSLGGLSGSSGSSGLEGLGGSTSGSSGLGSLGGASTSGSSGLGSLGGLTGSTGSSSGLGSLGGASGSSSSGLGSLGGLSGSGSSLTGMKERRQFDLGSLMGGTSGSSTSGLGGLTGSTGSSTSGLGGLTGSTGTSSGTTSSSGTSSAGTSSAGTSSTGTASTGTTSSGTSGLGSLGGSFGGLTGSTGSSSGTSTSSSGGGCKSVTLLFARGTGEMGTMGSVIGPPLADALASQLGADKVGSEGVDYPADAGGNANLGASGGPAMASQAQSILSSCPDTKLVLSGYSQGAMVVHNALSSQGLDGSKVAASVLFGDPFNGQALDGVDASKVKEFCGGADTLCSGGGGTTGSGSHLSYGGDADAAAQFVVSVIGA